MTSGKLLILLALAALGLIGQQVFIRHQSATITQQDKESGVAAAKVEELKTALEANRKEAVEQAAATLRMANTLDALNRKHTAMAVKLEAALNADEASRQWRNTAVPAAVAGVLNAAEDNKLPAGE